MARRATLAPVDLWAGGGVGAGAGGGTGAGAGGAAEVAPISKPEAAAGGVPGCL